jgi:NAD(P)-dependent dehydrogenase (short-subunit alcohol dehydrogenase family)
MDKHLQGRVALITGAGQGIGRAIAQRFAQEGAKIVVIDIVEANAQAVAEELKAAGAEAIGVACDVVQRDQVAAAVQAALDAFGWSR